jgi:hypothetical protein
MDLGGYELNFVSTSIYVCCLLEWVAVEIKLD